MNDTQIAKIRRFLADKEMHETIQTVLTQRFMANNSTDVQYLASQTLAYQLLQEAWKEMERYKIDHNTSSAKSNPGV